MERSVSVYEPSSPTPSVVIAPPSIVTDLASGSEQEDLLNNPSQYNTAINTAVNGYLTAAYNGRPVVAGHVPSVIGDGPPAYDTTTADIQAAVLLMEGRRMEREHRRAGDRIEQVSLFQRRSSTVR